MKVLTIEAKKPASASPLNRLCTTIASPVRGSIASKVVVENNQESNHMSNMADKNIMAGSGSLLPTRSMPLRNLATAPVG